jgi:hypothetical protein
MSGYMVQYPYCNLVHSKLLPTELIASFLKKMGIECIIINFDNVILNKDLSPYLENKTTQEFFTQHNIFEDYVDQNLLKHFIISLARNGIITYIVSTYSSDIVSQYLFHAATIDYVKILTPDFFDLSYINNSLFFPFIFNEYKFSNNEIMYMDTDSHNIEITKRHNLIKNCVLLQNGLSIYSLSNYMFSEYNWDYQILINYFYCYNNTNGYCNLNVHYIPFNNSNNIPNSNQTITIDNNEIDEIQFKRLSNKRNQKHKQPNQKHKQPNQKQFEPSTNNIPTMKDNIELETTNSEAVEPMNVETVKDNIEPAKDYIEPTKDNIEPASKNVQLVNDNIKEVEPMKIILEEEDSSKKLKEELVAIQIKLEEEATKRKKFYELKVKKMKEIEQLAIKNRDQEESVKQKKKQSEELERKKEDEEFEKSLEYARLEAEKTRICFIEEERRQMEEDTIRRKAEEEEIRLAKLRAETLAKEKEEEMKKKKREEKKKKKEEERRKKKEEERILNEALLKKKVEDNLKPKYGEDTVTVLLPNNELKSLTEDEYKKKYQENVDKIINTEIKQLAHRLANSSLNNNNLHFPPSVIFKPLLNFVTDIHNRITPFECKFTTLMLVDVSLLTVFTKTNPNNPVMMTATNIFKKICVIWEGIEAKIITEPEKRYFSRYIRSDKNISFKHDDHLLNLCHTDYNYEKEKFLKIIFDVSGFLLCQDDKQYQNMEFIIYANILLLNNIIWCSSKQIAIYITDFFNSIEIL